MRTDASFSAHTESDYMKSQSMGCVFGAGCLGLLCVCVCVWLFSSNNSPDVKMVFIVDSRN